MKPKTFKGNLFILLWLAGLVGELSVLWVAIPVPPGSVLPMPMPLLKLLGLIQSLVILSVAVLIGTAFAHKVGLSAPFAEAVSRALLVSKSDAIASLTQETTHTRPRPTEALIQQLIPGVIGGAVAVGLSLAWFLLMKAWLPADFLAASEQASIPIVTRLLKGGIAEEIVMRWGLMTLLVWLPWRWFQKRKGIPQRTWFFTAILVSSLAFGLLHLPAAFLFTAHPTGTLALYIIVGNTLFGLVAGFLYWKVGLESAIVAHMVFHGLLVVVQRIGWVPF